MDVMQQMINLMNENARLKSGQEYNLGSLIEDLEQLEQNKTVLIEKGVYPSHFSSWRGSYCELSLDYSDKKITVKELLEKAKEANGKEFIGYKGGEFIMDLFTPIHIAEYGRSSYTYKHDNADDYHLYKLIGITELEDKYILLTRDDNE
jgi:hypothetical protein